MKNGLQSTLRGAFYMPEASGNTPVIFSTLHLLYPLLDLGKNFGLCTQMSITADLSFFI